MSCKIKKFLLFFLILGSRNGKPTKIMKKWAKIYFAAERQNRRGNKFPIWGTCLGFEAIVYANSRYKIRTSEPDSLNVNKRLYWVNKNYRSSAFERELRLSVKKALHRSKIKVQFFLLFQS